MRLKVIGIQYEGDKHGRRLSKPNKNTFIEDVMTSYVKYTRAVIMVSPCNFKKRGEDSITTIWNTCRNAIKDTNLKILFVKRGIRFLVSSRSPFMSPALATLDYFESLNLHQIGPTWNDKLFNQFPSCNFYSDVNYSSFRIKTLYREIEKEKRSRAEKIYIYFASIGDKNFSLEENFLHFNERYEEYGEQVTMRMAVKASILRPFLIGICKKGSRQKLVESLRIYPYNNQRYKDDLIERHIDIIIEYKLYKSGCVEDDEINSVGRLLNYWASMNVNGYKGSTLEYACHYLENWCGNY